MDKEIIKKMDSDLIYAIIPARSGSKGVKNKNIRCINGYPLMAYSIAAARLCPQISRIIVSTDSEYYAEIARYYGAEVPFLRPEAFAADTSPDIEFVEHAIGWFYEHEGLVPGYLVHLRPTYPIRNVKVVSEAISQLTGDPEATSLRSAYPADFAPYKWFTKGADGYFQCLFEGMTPDEANQARQGFPQVYIPDGYVDVLRVPFIIKKDRLHGDKVKAFIVSSGTDVDTPREMKAVEGYMSGHEHELYLYLKGNYKSMEEAGL